MTKMYYVLVLMWLFVFNGFAHDANKSFFKIYQNGDFVEVEAEFPWSIRNAVLKEFPGLENSNNQKDFDAAFFDYISSNFSISSGNNFLSLLSIKAIAKDGHSHQNNFRFVFIGNNFDTVTNTIMFNIYENQENYHEVELNNQHEEFLTTPKNTLFKIHLDSDSESSKGNNTIVILFALVFIVLMSLLFFENRKKWFD